MSQKWLLSCKMGGWSRSRGGSCIWRGWRAGTSEGVNTRMVLHGHQNEPSCPLRSRPWGGLPTAVRGIWILTRTLLSAILNTSWMRSRTGFISENEICSLMLRGLISQAQISGRSRGSHCRKVESVFSFGNGKTGEGQGDSMTKHGVELQYSYHWSVNGSGPESSGLPELNEVPEPKRSERG